MFKVVGGLALLISILSVGHVFAEPTVHVTGSCWTEPGVSDGSGEWSSNLVGDNPVRFKAEIDVGREGGATEFRVVDGTLSYSGLRPSASTFNPPLPPTVVPLALQVIAELDVSCRRSGRTVKCGISSDAQLIHSVTNDSSRPALTRNQSGFSTVYLPDGVNRKTQSDYAIRDDDSPVWSLIGVDAPATSMGIDCTLEFIRTR